MEDILSELDSRSFLEFPNENSQLVHIRVKQRNGKKSVTTIAGIPRNMDFKKILRALKKNLSTNGHITEEYDKELDSEIILIHLQGDVRQKIKDFLVNEKIFDFDVVKIHGY